MSPRQWPKPFWPAKMVVEGVFLCIPGILSPLPGLIVHFFYVGHFCFSLDQFWTIWEKLRNFYKDKRTLIIQLSYLQDLLMEKQLVCNVSFEIIINTWCYVLIIVFYWKHFMSEGTLLQASVTEKLNLYVPTMCSNFHFRCSDIRSIFKFEYF